MPRVPTTTFLAVALQREMKERCEATAANFRETCALAMRGDYEGLMNAGAFMLETPDAHWPIKQDALLGCTWSLVAIASGSPKVNTGEVKIYEGRCVRDRSPTERAVIRQQATQLYQQLYGRPLPPDFYYAVRLPRSCSRAKFPASLMRANSIYLASLQKRGGSVVRRRPPKPAQAFSM